MRFLKLFICIACCLCSVLKGSEHYDFSDQEGVPSIIDLQGHPSSVVGGMVNVISGHLVDGDVDSLGVGPKPVTIQRYYNSGNAQRGTLCDGWDLNSDLLTSMRRQRIDTDTNLRLFTRVKGLRHARISAARNMVFEILLRFKAGDP